MSDKISRRNILKLFGVTTVAGVLPGVPIANALLSQNVPAVTRGIDELVKEVVSILRDTCRSQVDTWRKIPAWAIEADGRNGYSDMLQQVYNFHVWPVGMSNKPPLWQMSVHLDTGELVYGSEHNVVSDESVIGLAFHPDLINAQMVLDGLKKEAREPIGKFYDPIKNEEIRQRVRDVHRLGTPIE